MARWRELGLALVLALAPVPAMAQAGDPALSAVQQLIEAGTAQDAEKLARANLEAAAKMDGPKSLAAAKARLPLAYALFALGRGPEAVTLLGEQVVNASGVTIARSSGLSRKELILWCYFFF